MRALLPAVVALLLAACRARSGEVVVYASVDELYAREVFAAFTRETGVRVRAVFDTEEARTLGLVNRLMAERGDPQADVFWNGECARTELLASRGLLEPYAARSAKAIAPEWRGAAWTGFGARVRVIVYRPDRVKEPPRTIDALGDPAWRGRVAIANPVFGTTATHALAIAQERGEDGAVALFERLKANDVRVVGGNSHVRDLVARGECDLGLTDSDDVWVGRARGDAIEMVVPAPTLVIPNSVALVKGSPRPEEARAFIEWMLRPETEEMLARGPSRQIPVRGAGLPERRLAVEWSRALASEAFLGRLREALDL